MDFCRTVPGGVEIQLKVVPGASRSRVVGLLGGELKIQVAAPAEKGRANAAVIALLAELLGVSASRIELIRGQTQPRKVVHIQGVTSAAVRRLLSAGE